MRALPNIAPVLFLLACTGAEPDDDSPVDSDTQVEPTLPSGLIAHWTFDEGTGTTAADATGAHDATLVDGTAWTDGALGQAVLFDGVDDRVDIPDHAAFDFGTGDFSIAAWFNTTSAKDHHILNFRQDDNTPHIELYAAPLPFGYLGTHLDPGDTRISYDQPVNDGQWHHAGAVLAQGETDGYRLFFDGSVVGTNTYSGDLSNWDTIQIGAAGTMPRQWEGAIDEVMVFDRALSDAEMQQVYDYVASR